MAMYSNVDNTFGLRLSPRLKKIINAVDTNTPLSTDDMTYLIDNAGRFETLDVRVMQKSYPIQDIMLDNEFEIKDVLSDMMLELRNSYPSRINKGQSYKLELPQFHPKTEGAIDRLSADNIILCLTRAIRMVKDQQDTFDKNDDDLTVIGVFPHLKREYGVDVLVKPDTTVTDLLPPIVQAVKKKVEKDFRQQERALKALNTLQPSDGHMGSAV